MIGHKYMTAGQKLRAIALGLDTNSDPPITKTLAAGDIECVYDMKPKAAGNAAPDQRKPVFVRIVNLGTGAIKVLEDVFGDPAGVENHFPPPDADIFANMYGDLLQPAVATDDGSGEKVEWQHHRPQAIYIQAVADTKVTILKRFSDDN